MRVGWDTRRLQLRHKSVSRSTRTSSSSRKVIFGTDGTRRKVTRLPECGRQPAYTPGRLSLRTEYGETQDTHTGKNVRRKHTRDSEIEARTGQSLGLCASHDTRQTASASTARFKGIGRCDHDSCGTHPVDSLHGGCRQPFRGIHR